MPCHKPFPQLALPAGVNLEDTLWAPDATEVLLEKHLKELATIRAEQQRDWLEEQARRMAAVAMEIEAEDRRLKLIELQERQDAWWRDQQTQNDDIGRELAALQKQLDAATYKKLLDRVNKAGAEIKRDAAQLEREELKRRGVYRGRVTGHMAY